METKHCNYCGFFGGMHFLHGSYHCPKCHYHLLPGENEDDQDLFDDDMLDKNEIPTYLFQDLVLQRG